MKARGIIWLFLKKMGRLPRVYIEGILYCVTSRSIHGEKLFIDNKDYQELLSLIGQCRREYRFKLFAYLILPRKVQLVIELRNNVSISEIMYSINSRYTKKYNSRHNKKGHLLQDRFKLRLVEKNYLLPLVRDILLEPVRLGVVMNPADYPYSSYSHFIGLAGKQRLDLREEREELLPLLTKKGQRFENYIQNKDERKIGEFRKNFGKKRIFGSPDFVKQVKEKIKERKEEIKRKKTKKIPKRTKVILVLIISLAVLIGLAAVRHFYTQTVRLGGKYEKTKRLYLRTLGELKKEQSKLAGAEEGVEKYKWKIRLIENALKELQKKREETLKKEKEFENYAWKIKLKYIGGPKVSFPNTDVITFNEGNLRSRSFSQLGFKNSTYSKRKLNNEKIEWTTTQRNSKGDIVSWKGVWTGKIMKGAFSWQPADGEVRNFSFVSTSSRLKE